MKRKVVIPTVVIVAVITAVIFYSLRSGSDVAKPLEVEVRKGDFEVLVAVTGELQALRSTDIMAPKLLRSRSMRFRGIQIKDLVAEGTVVDSGDYVATLDRSEADNTFKDVLDELEKIQSQYTRTQLDTTMQLRNLRDEIINLEFNLEEAKITLEQSQFEPPATIRQAQINLDKAERAYEQAVKNYKLKVEQARADMTEVQINLDKQLRTKEEMEKILENFVIHAPAPGMVIYKREWNGQKRTVGSEIEPWDLTVATLPDMSVMLSQTYVNEIDISKIETGMNVRIGVDAFPEKKFTGEVTQVANIGEQLPNTDAKVFEVTIRLNESDPILRPSMTTSNQIITKTFEDVLYLPLEAIHTNDSLTYVYRRNGIRQVVVLDESNENEIIVEQGLKEGEKVYLSVPPEEDKYKYAGLELAEVIRARKEEQRRLQEQENAVRNQRGVQGRRQFQRPSGAARGDGESSGDGVPGSQAGSADAGQAAADTTAGSSGE